jgi:hypothetical protein
MDGTTAAERICPWRRSSIPDERRSSSVSSDNDHSIHDRTSLNTADPHLHSSPLTSANFAGAYHKSPEYLGEYATTTKQEEHVLRPNIRDLFDNPSRTSDDKNENETKTASDDSTTHL